MSTSFQRVNIGRFESRALWHPSSNPEAPALVMIPGSGANGPKEAVPASLTVSRKDSFLFLEVARPFVEAGFSVLLLGKPGVEYHTTFEIQDLFYDVELYKNLHWRDLIENLDDGVSYVRSQPQTSPREIYVLGHSEGTQVATDYAHAHPEIKGVILLGYLGQSVAATLDWQLFRRVIDNFVATDVDTDHDGFVTVAEALVWGEAAIGWPWTAGADRMSYKEIEESLRADPQLIDMYTRTKTHKLYSDGVFERTPIIDLTARLRPDVQVFNGALDVETRPEESLELSKRCAELHKENYQVELIAGLGHAFSRPRPPRSHPLLDLTVGPVDPRFIEILDQYARRLAISGQTRNRAAGH